MEQLGPWGQRGKSPYLWNEVLEEGLVLEESGVGLHAWRPDINHNYL